MEKPKEWITVQAQIDAPVGQVWNFWTSPEAITKWNQASDDWHTPYVDNNVRIGATFLWRMEAKDGSFGFDFGGTYKVVKLNEQIQYEMEDGRNVKINFEPVEGKTKVTETFEAENQNSLELQRAGWQAILDNFRKYVESNKD
jgi:uncharacterized protein YndB with AHSA1/START domain